MDLRRQPAKQVRYVVARGDTVSEIAERYNVRAGGYSPREQALQRQDSRRPDAEYSDLRRRIGDFSFLI